DGSWYMRRSKDLRSGARWNSSHGWNLKIKSKNSPQTTNRPHTTQLLRRSSSFASLQRTERLRDPVVAWWMHAGWTFPRFSQFRKRDKEARMEEDSYRQSRLWVRQATNLSVLRHRLRKGRKQRPAHTCKTCWAR